MKVLLAVMSLDIGGVETHVVELAAGLLERGILPVVASNGGRYVKELEQLGIKHYKVPLHNKKIGNMLRSYRMLKKIIRDEKVDVVHAHARIPGFILGKLHKRMGFPFVTSAHWVFHTNWLLKRMTDWGQETLAVSEDIKKYLMESYGLPAEQIAVTINGISTKRFSKDLDTSAVFKEFDLKKDHERIVYISRMDTDRSLVAHHLLASAEEIQKASAKPVDLIIVGGGNDFEQIAAEAEAVNQKAGRRMAVLAGARTDVNAFAALADIFIGVSRSALEAMAAEKPVIVGGNEGYLGIFEPEMLERAQLTNFCCRGEEASSPEKLLADVKKLLGMDKSEREALGVFSKSVIEKYYSVGKMTQDNIDLYEKALKHSEKETDVLISGFYGFSNSGDDAILEAMVKSFQEKDKSVRITALSKNPKRTERLFGIRAISRTNLFQIRKALKNTKLFISGGGSLIQDATSTRSILYYLAIIRMATRSKARTMLYANGIGPVHRPFNRRLVKRVLNRVDVITLREKTSYEDLLEMGVNKPKTLVTADPALTLKPASFDEVKSIFDEIGVDPQKPLAIMSVRKWRDLTNEGVSALARAADYLKKEQGMQILWIPLHLEQDLELAKKVSGLMTEASTVLTKVLPAEALLGVISAADLLIGMRLHALIYSACVLVPTIGLVYDPKVEAFLDYMEIPNKIEISALRADKLIRLCDEVIGSRDEMKAHLRERKEALCALENQNTAIAFEMINL